MDIEIKNIKNINNFNNTPTFKDGAFLIFKKWSTFRIALDNSPHILRQYVDEDKQNELEFNFILNQLLNDISLEIKNTNDRSNSLINSISETLCDFLDQFFNLYIEGGDENFVAKSLVKLYDELAEGKVEYYEKLKVLDSKHNYSVYSIEFPLDVVKAKTISMMNDIGEMDIDEDGDGDSSDDEDYRENNNENENRKGDLKTKVNEPDDDGFIVVQKKKKK